MKKRIFGWICTLLAVAMLCSSFALADTQPDAIGSIISGMSLRDKLAQMMLFSIRTWKEDASSDTPAEDVRVLNDYIRQYIADHRFGGILLFSENCGDAEQVARLVSALQSVNQNIRKTQSDLKDVNRLLKLDPGTLIYLPRSSGSSRMP